MLRPISYERVSTFQQVEMGKGLVDQRSSLTAFLDKNADKFTDERVFITDEGVSAFKNANIAPESSLGKFLQDIRDKKYGKGDALIVCSLDRLSRRSSWSENTIQFIVAAGIVIYDISTDVVLRDDDSFSKILMEIILQRSHNESLMKSVRAKVAWQNKVQRAVANGEVVSNRMPFWLENIDNKYSVNQEQAELITRCFEWYKQGFSTGEIVKRIDDPKWQMVRVSRLIRDRRLLGEHKRYNGEVIPNVYPKIVDDELFIMANRMMDTVMTEKKKPAEDLLLEPEVVKTIFSLYESGLGSGAIVKRLPDGWSTVNVLRVLRDKRVIAQKIIDNLSFERVNEKLNKNGVANRIRKDVTIAQDDYITNLFPRVLKCGCCNGNIAIHYNHVRTKYVICRTREEKKRCDAKSIQYTRIEKNILSTVLNIDFSKFLEDNPSEISNDEVLKSELLALRQEEQIYQRKILKRKEEGKKASLPLMDGLTDVQDRIDDLITQIKQVSNVQDIPKLDYDLDSILDPMNVELRAKVRKELKQVLSKITYRVIEKFILLELHYFTDVLKHILIIDNKRGGGTLQTQLCIRRVDGGIWYEAPSFKLEVNERELVLVHDGDINIIEYSLLLNYVDTIQTAKNVAEWMRNQFSFLTYN
ncbi:recombinase family protein [Kosakonia sp. S58]|uniref:recombinase family protein n=1 Tax=unclassified Kosakonia TaxID=2632876 RepID=UPI001908D651|nr:MULTISPECIES: recombinase family protein [unclassified Kosakonia]MBK0077885.1 recombinase family protein [Kosakonia sp. S57]MBK0084863.1 recombinase family protein [Kosakonia sp. S58]